MKTALRACVTLVLGLLYAVELQAGNLRVNLAPSAAVSAGAQWRVDNGNWKNSGATVNNLSNTSHEVTFKAVSGWLTPAPVTVTLTAGNTTTITASYVRPAALKIDLTPTSGQWRIDGGSWRASGATVTGLTPGAHTIDYAGVSGYTSPSSETVTLVETQTTTLARSYVQLATVTVTLSPATAQWRVDGGVWRNSGNTATNLTPGSHTIDYAPLAGYAVPASESVTLTAGQSLPLARSYTQLASITATITPAGSMWRVDGGAIVNSGATIGNLAPGSHTIDYFAPGGWAAPTSENVTLTAGQSLTLSRSSTQLAQLTVSYPLGAGYWRKNGGPWSGPTSGAIELFPGSYTIEYSALSGWAAPSTQSITLTGGQSLVLNPAFVQLGGVAVTLTPASAQWNVDGNAWQPSGNSWSGLTPGAHTINYNAVAGYATPAPEVVTIVSGQTTSISRSYVQLAQVTINLTPASAQWRIDGGAWRNSGTTAANLSLGSHTIDYAAVSGYTAPTPETITLTAGQSLSVSRDYLQLAQLSVTLTPANAQWRVDGGAWQVSGATVGNLTPGNHAVDYSTLQNYGSPTAETVTLAAGQSQTLTRDYVQYAQILLGLVPASGQWRANGGPWQASGTSLFVPPGTYAIDYSALELYDAPATENLTLTAGGLFATTRYYVSQKPTLRINLSPATGQWRIDGGAWQTSGTQLTELTVGSHTIDYTDIGGDHAPLASETVSLALRDNVTLTRTYPFKPASLALNLSPANAQWRVIGSVISEWQNSGAVLGGLAPGSYTIEYSNIADYTTPANELVTLTPAQAAVLSRNYTPYPARLQVITIVSGGLWRVYPQGSAPSGTWKNSGDIATGLPVGDYVIEYAAVPNHTAPPTETVTLTVNQLLTLNRPYTAHPAQATVTLTPSNAQWRIYASTGNPATAPWNASAQTVANLTPGNYIIEFSDVPGFVNPGSYNIALTAGFTFTLTRNYAAIPASLTVTLSPSSGQWSVDGGPFMNSGATLNTLSPGTHTVTFSSVFGYATPAPQTITVTSGEERTLSATYTPVGAISVSVQPTWVSGQWRVDGGDWKPLGSTASDLAVGVPHTVEFSDVSGYITPSAQTVTLAAGEYRSVSATYVQLAVVYVNVNPSWVSAQWRIDGGPWQSTGSGASNLSLNVPHTIDFAPVSGYITPASQTVTLSAGEYRFVTGTYVQLAAVYANVNPSWINGAQWRIDNGPWQAIGIIASNLSFDVSHTIDFSPVSGYVTPASQTVTLSAGEYRSVTGTYVQLATVYVNVDPSWIDGAQWRIDNGPWQAIGIIARNLSFDVPHTIDFSPLTGYVTPASQTITLSAGEFRFITGNYAQLAGLYVSLSLNVARWRVDGGPWNANGAAAYNLSLGTHTVEYSQHDGYLTPSTETVTLSSGYNSLSRSYASDPSFVINWSLSGITVVLDPAFAEWRIDGGRWNTSGASRYNLTPGTHTIEYATVADWISPASETVTLDANTAQTRYVSYTSIDPAQLTITTNPASGQWRVYRQGWPATGTWQASGGTATGLNPGPYTIEYAPVTGYDAPFNNGTTLQPDESQSISAAYQPRMFQYKIVLNPSTGRFRLNGGAWNPSGATTMGHQPGNYLIEFEPVPGYITPAPVTVTFEAGANQTLTYTYSIQ